MELINTIKEKYRNGNIAVKIIYINFGVQLISSLLSLFNIEVSSYFSVPYSFSALWYKLWTPITYTFVHANFFHLLLNMTLLYFVGLLFLQSFREKAFLLFYFMGGVTGALTFLIFSTYHGDINLLSGASAAVYSILFAVAAYSPKVQLQTMFLNIPIRVRDMAILLLGYDIIMILAGKNMGGHISHLGGAGFGYFYMKSFEKGNDFLGIMAQKMLRSFSPKTVINHKKNKEHLKNETNSFEYKNDQKSSRQKEIDRILDKISRSGYDSLSIEEKDFLFHAGKDN